MGVVGGSKLVLVLPVRYGRFDMTLVEVLAVWGIVLNERQARQLFDELGEADRGDMEAGFAMWDRVLLVSMLSIAAGVVLFVGIGLWVNL